MRQMEASLITRDTFTRLCGQLSSKLCCLPVCVLSWLISYSHMHHLAPGHPGQVPGHEAGTKSIARLYTLGGAEWFVTVLVERLLGLVYSTDLDRATAAVFSLLHIDLVPCNLALLLHTLPRCLVGEGREQLLVHPGAKCLARLTVDCKDATMVGFWEKSQKSDQMPYFGQNLVGF